MPHKSREDYNAYMREYNKRRYFLRREKAIEQLGGKCVDCDSTEGLEFDHVDPSTKSFTVGRALGNVSEKKLQNELSKCVLRCKECHAIKSIREGDLPPLATHGTVAMYQHHDCRCEACKKAQKIAHKEYYEKNKDEINRRKREKRKLNKQASLVQR